MNRSQAIRRTFPHMVIALAVCVGAWIVFVQPKLEAIAQAAGDRADNAVQLTPEQQWRLARHLEEIHDWLGGIESLNDFSRDSNQMFSTIMELAESRNVQVVSIQPGSAQRRSGKARDRRKAAEVVAVVNLEIVAHGRYKDIAEFIDSITQHSPFIKPSSLQIAPASDGPPPTVSARLTCDVLSFTAPPAIAGLTGDDDAH